MKLKKIGCYQSSNFFEISDRIEKNCVSCSGQLLKKWKHVLDIFHLSKSLRALVEVRDNNRNPECVVVAIKSNCTLRKSSYNYKTTSVVQTCSSQEDNKHTEHVDNSEAGAACFPWNRKNLFLSKKSFSSLTSTRWRQFFISFGTEERCEKKISEIQNRSVTKFFKHSFIGTNKLTLIQLSIKKT